MKVASGRGNSLFLPAVRRVVPVFAVLVIGAAGPAGAQLVNPAFDSGPAGPVGNFGTVVGPPFQGGFWGAEDANIVNVTTCGTPPRSNPFMLSLNVGGGSYSQAWQAVDVTAGPPTTVSLRAWANTCSTTPGVTVGVEIRTYNNANGWPNHTLLANTSLQLDTDPDTWQQVSLNCVLIPADTQWILPQLFLANATSGSTPAYMDDVELIYDECPTPTVPSTWSSIKALMGGEPQ
jgi:hypothetical protein